jgi:hypothetical protein
LAMELPRNPGMMEEFVSLQLHAFRLAPGGWTEGSGG